MTNPRNYKGIRVDIEVSSTKDGNRWNILLPPSEGWQNIEIRTTIALHLRFWGYRKEDIRFEELPKELKIRRRPDILAMGTDGLPNFWFECKYVSYDRLSEISDRLGNFRVVNVIKANLFRKTWNHIDWEEDCVTKKTPEWEKLLTHWKELIPPNTELWATSEDMPAGYIAFAVRRGNEDDFTFLDTGEGNRIREFNGFSKIKSRIGVLIPGVVGRGGWSGKSHRTE